jgi:hypothetical protein
VTRVPRRTSSRLLLTLVAFAGLIALAIWGARPRSPSTPGAPEAPVPATPAPATPAATGSGARASDGGPSAAPVNSGGGAGPTQAEIASLQEAQLMARLRKLAETDSEGAITLAREGNRRFPGSADAPERTSILIHALANVGHSMEARGEAEKMVNEAPDSEWVREIERFTGAHRHRNVRVNDAGAIEFY